MECKATVKYISATLGGADLILHVDGTPDMDGLTDTDVRLSITKWRERRSKDANAYFHVLADKLADALRMSKPRMKNYLLYRYGQKARDKDGNLVVIKTNADEDELVERSDIHCWYIKDADDGTPMYVLLEHSRYYDTKQMSILIDGVIDECKGQGIETMTPNELAELKAKWRCDNGKHNTDT